MKTTEKIDSLNLNFVRSRVAKRPAQDEIAAALEKANKLYAQSAGRAFEPSIYTR